MKKLIALLLALAMVLCMVACGESKGPQTDDPGNSNIGNNDNGLRKTQKHGNFRHAAHSVKKSITEFLHAHFA